MSCYEKEHKIMINGGCQHFDIFIDDYPNLSYLKLSTKLQVPNVVHPDLELPKTSPIDKNTNDSLYDDHQRKACSTVQYLLPNCLKKLDANQEQHLKDTEAQFTNKLKQQTQYFEDEITEVNEAYKIKIETLANTVKKLNSKT